MKSLIHTTAIALTLSGIALPAVAETKFITLGTSGGPNARSDRSQPANVLIVDDTVTLVDLGDGFAGRLNAAGVQIWDVDNALISHLHFDHMGGLLALLGLRFQTNPGNPVQVYGPPGTEQLVMGMLEGMAPAMEAAYGMEDAQVMSPEELVQVHEIRDGDSFDLNGTTVTTVKNTHYSFEPGSEMDKNYESVSFRFDTPDRSIVYTGDTGPSEAVTKLAQGADLLVSELIDLPAVMAQVHARPGMTDEKAAEVERHLSNHHVTPTQIGEMASTAGVGAVVATHLVAGRGMSPEQTQGWADEIGAVYDGKITIAEDLQEF